MQSNYTVMIYQRSFHQFVIPAEARIYIPDQVRDGIGFVLRRASSNRFNTNSS
jgi:hypothetical protein